MSDDLGVVIKVSADEGSLNSSLDSIASRSRKGGESAGRAFAEGFKSAAISINKVNEILESVGKTPIIKNSKGQVKQVVDDFGNLIPSMAKKGEQAGDAFSEAMRKSMASERFTDRQIKVDTIFNAPKSQEIFKQAGIRSPEEVKMQLGSLNEARQMWKEAGSSADGYHGAMARITSQTNLLLEGNARARGSLHQLAASMASLTFELTGAIYGFTALGAILAGPGLFGVGYLKSIEDAKHGIAATLTAMTTAAGVQLTYAQSSSIASNEINSLAKNALKYNVSLEDITKTYQAIIGPGLAAGMTLREVGQIATIGTMAVKSLGLDSRQVVQEVRDLVQGGIQAASSTLATSLGLKDKDITAAKQSAEGLFSFLEKRLSGYSLAAMERQNTLSGSWDVLKVKVQRLFADESGFNVFKSALNKVSEAIGEINYQTGEIKFNPELLKVVSDYWSALTAISSVLGTVVSLTVKFSNELMIAGAAFASWKLGALIATPLVETFAALSKSLSALPALLESTALGVAGVGTATATLGSKWAALSLGAKGGLIGLALFGTYVVADYFGIVDTILDNSEKRLKKFRDSTKQMSNAFLEAQVTSLENQLRSAEKEESKGGIGSTFAAKRRQELERELRSAQDEQQKRLDVDNLMNSRETELQRSQAFKEARSDASKYKDSLARYETYNNEVAKIAARYVTMTKTGATTEQIDEATKLYNRGIAQAQKELNKITPEQRKQLQENEWFKGQLNKFDELIRKSKEYFKSLEGDSSSTNIVEKFKDEVAKRRAGGKPVSASEESMGLARARLAQEEVDKETLDKIQRTTSAFIKDKTTATEEFIRAQKESLDILTLEAEYGKMSKDKVEQLKLEAVYQKEINKLTAEYNKQREATKDSGQKARLDSDLQTQLDAINLTKETALSALQERQDAEKTWQKGAQDAINDYNRNVVSMAESTRKTLTTAFAKLEDVIINFAKTGKLSFKDLFSFIAEEMLRANIRKTVSSESGAGGLLGSVLSMVGMGNSNSSSVPSVGSSDWSSYFQSLFPSANGNVFQNSMPVQAFAMGGAFTNSIVSQPTVFPMAKGAGLMGEAGPEAVVPLTRTSTGHLGVRMTGSGENQGVSISQNFTIDARGADANVDLKIRQAMQQSKVETIAAVNDQLRRGGATSKNVRNT